MIDGNAKACTVRQRRVENTLEATHAEVAGGTLEITAEFRRRLFRHQQHRAAGRVAATQRALRAFEPLHVLQVEETAGADTNARRRPLRGESGRGAGREKV